MAEQWEYMEIDDDQDEATAKLTELGAQGWEVVGQEKRNGLARIDSFAYRVFLRRYREWERGPKISGPPENPRTDYYHVQLKRHKP
jgi:hypothetical protein